VLTTNLFSASQQPPFGNYFKQALERVVVIYVLREMHQFLCDVVAHVRAASGIRRVPYVLLERLRNLADFSAFLSENEAEDAVDVGISRHLAFHAVPLFGD
jgi:hypothetical protein